MTLTKHFFRKYFEIGHGEVPVVLSCPHGGFKKPKSIPDKKLGFNLADKRTYIIAKKIMQEFEKKEIKIYYLFSKIHRSKVDLNRPPKAKVAYDHNSIEARNIHFAYHDILLKFTQECVSKFRKCLIIDLHGFTKPKSTYPDIIFGNVFGKTLKIKNHASDGAEGSYWVFSSLIKELKHHYTLDDGLGITDFNLAYSGGYITNQFYKIKNVNAFQLEVAKHLRLNNKKMNLFVELLVNNIKNSLDGKKI